MIKKIPVIFILSIFALQLCDAQEFLKTADLFRVVDSIPGGGTLNIYQQPEVDTLLSRYLIASRKLGGGMDGFRIEIFSSSERNARDEANKKRAEFMIEFPDIESHLLYRKPGYFIVRAGDFRTKTEGTKSLYLIRRKFPNAYLVIDVINFPDLNKN